MAPVTHDLDSLKSRIAAKEDALFCLLFANSQPRLGTYIALAHAIQATGHLAVVVHTSARPPSTEELTGFESVEFASIPARAIKGLESVDLFFSAEVVFDVAPNGAATIGIFHSLPDQGLAEGRFVARFPDYLRHKPTIIRSFDYLVAAVRQRQEDWDPDAYRFIDGIYPGEFLRHRRPSLDIVPGGYPKLDYSRRLLTSSTPPSCILYSPTSEGSGLTRVRDDGEAILAALLRSFPGWQIVLRPYPAKRDLDYGHHLAQAFAGYANFVLDQSVTGVHHQRDAAVAITDSSSSAITFALATSRPLVFVTLDDDGPPAERTGKKRLSRRGVNPGEQIGSPVKNPFGFTARSIPDLIAAVGNGIEDAAEWSTTIETNAESYVYNSRTSSAYLASHVERFAERETCTDWLSVPRGPWIQPADQAGAEQHLARLRALWPATVGANAARARDEIAAYLDSGTPTLE